MTQQTEISRPKTMAVVQKGDKEVVYVPHGSADQIKLNLTVVKSLCCEPTRTGQVCTDRDAYRFMALCQGMKLNPFEQDAYLVGYDSQNGPVFSLITAHKAFLKRAELHPEFDGMESGVIVQDEDGSVHRLEGDFRLEGQKLLGGWARVHFKNRKLPVYRALRLESRLKKTNKGEITKFWADDPEGQIVKCAEADALRSSFPTMLGALYLREEMRQDGGAPNGEDPIAASLVKVISSPSSLAEAEGDRTLLESPKPRREKTPQESLTNVVVNAGHTFDDYREFWRKEGPPEINCDDWVSFDDVPADWAARHVKASVGMLKALETMKGGK